MWELPSLGELRCSLCHLGLITHHDGRIIQTLVFAFSHGGKGITLNWWGNTVSTAGVDYLSYNQNSTLLPIPDVGYFGLPPDQYPLSF